MLFRAVLTFFIYTLKSFFAKTLRRIPKHYVFSESKGPGEKNGGCCNFLCCTIDKNKQSTIAYYQTSIFRKKNTLK